MTNSIPARNRPRFPFVPFLICVTGLVAGIAFLLTRAPVDSKPERVGEPPEISVREAARVRALMHEDNSGSPLATTNRGSVVAISDQRIIVENGGQQGTWLLAADTQIWKNREAIDVADVRTGDTVEVDLQQLGSRSDGWLRTAVKINVVSDELPDTTNSNQLTMPATEVTGVVVEARKGVIAIENAKGLQSTYPLTPTALILDGSEAIPLNELAAGENVKLTTSKSGSRADGWIVVVNQVERQP